MEASDWRVILYPLGFLSSLAFGGRFLVQWMQSEKEKKSVVTPLFWHLSLAGNLLLLIHSIIQMQYHVGIVQTCNAVVSWRNLNLMQTAPPPLAFKKVLTILLSSMLVVSALFAIQVYEVEGQSEWFRIPLAPWQKATASPLPLLWHLVGFAGLILFSSRFWVQWWIAEKSQKSELTASFWWISLVGALLSLVYSARIEDSVNAIGPLVGMIPYLRNLMLIQKRLAAQ